MLQNGILHFIFKLSQSSVNWAWYCSNIVCPLINRHRTSTLLQYFYHFDIVITSKQRRFNVMCRLEYLLT